MNGNGVSDLAQVFGISGTTALNELKKVALLVAVASVKSPHRRAR
jgi:hypothetical protein